MNLSGKVAIITGGSRGIGRAIAITLSKYGASVVISYSKDEEGAKDTLNFINNNGGYCLAKRFDVSSFTECSKAVQSVIDTFGKVDILVNNAGISNIGLFIDADEALWNRLIDVNIKGVFNMSKCVLSSMLKNHSGSILNISSIWGVNGASCESIYSATKGAINSFTKALAKEMGPSGIRVNAIAPGVINTGMNSWMSPEEEEELTNSIPMGCFGTPSDVGELAAFLCSEKAKYINGQTVIVDGGLL
ncbi:3-oxoacyl-[acyl-carrier-protein] reductase FabG [Clostridium sp. N3C]|uniref:elongation factor P 5-aminopentanone reductase n=1 Tax=Clostridium sp. N3C TaxID=1776758 RepID=UPI00092DF127|nr:SDR family oxidoreductase [Clostridium sp. N3C]SCN22343.1 3-oxoacyl-[acyl-carrier-protein] reductase FabG [Clostridium sp. N3C]